MCAATISRAGSASEALERILVRRPDYLGYRMQREARHLCFLLVSEITGARRHTLHMTGRRQAARAIPGSTRANQIQPNTSVKALCLAGGLGKR
jgi:hypothetical protein